MGSPAGKNITKGVLWVTLGFLAILGVVSMLPDARDFLDVRMSLTLSVLVILAWALLLVVSKLLGVWVPARGGWAIWRRIRLLPSLLVLGGCLAALWITHVLPRSATGTVLATPSSALDRRSDAFRGELEYARRAVANAAKSLGLTWYLQQTSRQAAPAIVPKKLFFRASVTHVSTSQANAALFHEAVFLMDQLNELSPPAAFERDHVALVAASRELHAAAAALLSQGSGATPNEPPNLTPAGKAFAAAFENIASLFAVRNAQDQQEIEAEADATLKRGQYLAATMLFELHPSMHTLDLAPIPHWVAAQAYARLGSLQGEYQEPAAADPAMTVIRDIAIQRFAWTRARYHAESALQGFIRDQRPDYAGKAQLFLGSLEVFPYEDNQVAVERFREAERALSPGSRDAALALANLGAALITAAQGEADTGPDEARCQQAVDALTSAESTLAALGNAELQLQACIGQNLVAARSGCNSGQEPCFQRDYGSDPDSLLSWVR